MGDTLVESGEVAAGMYGTGGGLDPFMGTDIYEMGNEFKECVLAATSCFPRSERSELTV
jgi:hypothetical protein